MSGHRIEVQFSRIFTYFGGKDTDTSLSDIADILCCTQRNARLVLNRMVDMGWLSWRSAVGRGKQSHLSFHQSEMSLQSQRVRDGFLQGDIQDVLIYLRGDKRKLTQLIVKQQGLCFEQGHVKYRLATSRSFSFSHPYLFLPRIEQELFRLIYSGLTKFNHETAHVEPDLAHRWEKISAFHWRFYLRPRIFLHDGELLTDDIVISSLSLISDHTYFKHIKHVDSSCPHVIDIYLSYSDERLPLTLSHPIALIHPKEPERENKPCLSPGTGKIKLVQHNEKNYQFSLHEQYFGAHPSFSQIEYWHISNDMRAFLTADKLLDKTFLDSHCYQLTAQKSSWRLHSGCYSFVLNANNGFAEDADWRQYLTFRLNSHSVMASLMQKKLGQYRLANAYSFFPSWIHTHTVTRVNIPQIKNVRLVYRRDDHLQAMIIDSAASLLIDESIEVEILPLSQIQWCGYKPSKKDIVLISIDFDRQCGSALLAWLTTLPMLIDLLPVSVMDEIEKVVNDFRQSKLDDLKVEELGQYLIEKMYFIPICHQWLFNPFQQTH